MPSSAIVLTVIRLDTRAPIQGAQIQVTGIVGQAANPIAIVAAGNGETDAAGKFVFMPPATAGLPTAPSFWRFDVHGPLDFLFQRFVDVPFGETPEPVVGICPEGTDPVVCEIAERQIKTAEQLAILNAQWGSSGQTTTFSLDAAHAYMENLDNGPKDPRLKARWIGDTSWGLMDFAIPPIEWPVLLEGRSVMLGIVDEVPWPDVGGSNVFQRCAMGLPIWRSLDGQELFTPESFRLFAPSFSDYWPRSEKQIRQDLAFRWLMAVISDLFGGAGDLGPGIVTCVIKKMAEKAKDVQRSRKAWGMIGAVAGICLSPLMGPAIFGTMITNVAEIVQLAYQVPPSTEPIAESVAYTTLVLGGEPNAQSYLTDSLTKALSTLLPPDMNSIVREIFLKGAPKVAEIAIQQFGLGTPGAELATQGAFSIGQLLNLGSIVQGVLGQAVTLLVNSIKGIGAKKLSHYYDQVMDLQNLPAKMVPFLLWIQKTLMLDVVFEGAAQQAGLSDLTGDADKDALDPWRAHAAANGVAIPSYLQSAGAWKAKKAAHAAIGLLGGAASLGLPFFVLPALMGGSGKKVS